MLDFLYTYWPIIALIISELLALVPSKWNGIAQSIFKILSLIFGKKEKESIKSENKKFYN